MIVKVNNARLICDKKKTLLSTKVDGQFADAGARTTISLTLSEGLE